MDGVVELDADFKISIAFDCVYARLIDVVFVFQTVTFVLLLYVIFVLTRKSSVLAQYRVCLLINIVGIELFELVLVIDKPTVVPSGVYIVPNGFIRWVDSRLHYIVVYVLALLFFAHIMAMVFCLLYQYAQISSARPLKYVFSSGRRILVAYGGYIAATFALAAFLVAQIRVNFDVSDTVLRGAVLYEFRGSPVMFPLLVCYVLLSTAAGFFAFFICWRTYTVLKATSYFRTSRTAQMQMTLLKSVVAQAACLFLLYNVPVTYIIATFAYPELQWSATGCTIAMIIMVFYAPLNYIIIFAFITQLRNELKRLFNRLLCITGLSKKCQVSSGVHFTEQSLYSLVMRASNVHVGNVSIRRLS